MANLPPPTDPDLGIPLPAKPPTPRAPVSDYLKAFGSSMANAYLTTPGQAFKMMGGTGETVREGQRIEKEIDDTISPAGQEVTANNLVNPDGSIGPTPLQTIAMAAVRSVPSVIQSMQAAAPISRALEGVNVAGRVASAAERVGIPAPKWVGNVVENAPFGVIEGVQAGLQNSAQTGQQIRDESQTPTDQMAFSPEFQKALVTSIESDPTKPAEWHIAQAREAMAQAAERDVLLHTIPSTGGIGILTQGGALPRLTRGLTGGARKEGETLFQALRRGAGEEALQETPQSGMEQLIQNAATQKYANPNQALTEDVVNQALLGGAAGGLMGGVGGGVAHVTSNRRPTPQEIVADPNAGPLTKATAAGQMSGAIPSDMNGEPVDRPQPVGEVPATTEATAATTEAPVAEIPNPADHLTEEDRDAAYDEAYFQLSQELAPQGIEPSEDEIRERQVQILAELVTERAGAKNPSLPEAGNAAGLGVPGPATGGTPAGTIDEAAHGAATSPTNNKPEPTPAQIEAGNYGKGHLRVNGHDISIENDAGSTRTGPVDETTGKPAWQTQMVDHYGYIRRTEGADSTPGKPQQVDAFVKAGTPENHTGPVYVIDQTKPEGGFDEHKVMFGYASRADALRGYLRHYEPGWNNYSAVRRLEPEAFNDWLKNGDTKSEIAPQVPETPEPDSTFANPENPAEPPETPGQTPTGQAPDTPAVQAQPPEIKERTAYENRDKPWKGDTDPVKEVESLESAKAPVTGWPLAQIQVAPSRYGGFIAAPSFGEGPVTIRWPLHEDSAVRAPSREEAVRLAAQDMYDRVSSFETPVGRYDAKSYNQIKLIKAWALKHGAVESTNAPTGSGEPPADVGQAPPPSGVPKPPGRGEGATAELQPPGGATAGVGGESPAGGGTGATGEPGTGGSTAPGGVGGGEGAGTVTGQSAEPKPPKPEVPTDTDNELKTEREAAQRKSELPPITEGDRIRFKPFDTEKYNGQIEGVATQIDKTSGGNLRIRIRTDEAAPQGGGNVARVVYSQDGNFTNLTAASVPASDMSPAARFEALRSTGKEDALTNGIQAFAKIVGRSGESVVDVWHRWSSFIGATAAVEKSSGADLVKWMQENVGKTPQTQGAPGDRTYAYMNSGSVAYWRDKLTEYERRMPDFEKHLAKWEEQARDIEELGGDENVVNRARKAVAETRNIVNENGKTIKEGLADAEKREKEQADKESAEEQARYQPADIKELSKKPTPASIDEWFTGKYKGADVWTNGHILDLGGPPHLAGWEGRMSALRKDAHPDVERIIPKEKGERVGLAGVYAGKLGAASKGVVYLEGGDHFLGVARQYFQYFASKYPGAEFFAATDTGPVSVYHNGKLVGLVMPIRLGEDGPALVKAMLAKNAPAPKVEPVAAAPEPGTNTEDAGAELSYNRRNRIKTGIRWDDIADKDAALRVKETTKQNVYPRPDYQELVDGGMEPVVAYIVKQAYDTLANAPVTRAAPTDEQLRTYIEGVHRYMDGVLAWAKDYESVKAWLNRIAESAGNRLRAMKGAPTLATSLTDSVGPLLLDTVYPDGWKEHRQEVMLVGGNKALGGLQPRTDDAIKALKEIEKGWPGKQEAWQRQGYRVVNGDDVTPEYWEPTKGTANPGVYVSITAKGAKGSAPIFRTTIEGATSKDDPRVQEWVKTTIEAVRGRYLLLDKRGRMQGAYETEDAAKEAAREQTKRDGKGGIKDEGISVEAAERTGVEHRLPGEDVSSDRLMETFGFKGVNFGNWMKGGANEAERQLHLNHAYDAFMDLAAILDVPPKAMSLDGLLGLAIGAQGSGHFAAHFVPGVNEINLTRTSGAGSLAHEWAHAVDHYFARQADLTREAEPYLTEHATQGAKATRMEMVNGKYQSVERLRFGENVRPEIVQAFKTIAEAMTRRPITLEEQAKARRDALSDAKRRTDSWLDAVRRDFVKSKASDDVLAAFDSLADRVRKLDLGEGMVSIGRNTAVYEPVASMRDIYKRLTGRVYSIDALKGLQSNINALRYLSSAHEESKQHVAQTGTAYLSAALSLDQAKGGKPYWSTKTEMFARAFDAFVSDRLAAQSAKNSYLSHAGREDETVPAGTERTTINEAIQGLVDALKHEPTDSGVRLFLRGESRGGMTPDVVRSIVNTLSARWKNAPRITIVETLQDPAVPEALRAEDMRQRSQGAKGEPKGFFHEGEVFLVASQLRSTLDVVRTLFHESLGHYGLRGLFGNALGPILDQIAVVRRAETEKVAARYGLDMNNATDRSIAAEEVLANMAQANPHFGFVRRAIAAIRTWLRSKGIKFAISDDEIVRDLILPAREFVKQGRAAAAPTMTPAMSRSGAQRATAAVNRVVANLKSGGFRTTWQGVKDFAANHRDFGLQFIGRRQIADIYGKLIPALRPYSDEMQHYDADKNAVAGEADELVGRWRKLADNALLADTMHGATLTGYDPDVDQTPVELMTPEMRSVYEDWTRLSDEAKDVYRKARDMYAAHWAKVKAAIGDRIRRSAINGRMKQQMMAEMESEFAQQLSGVYFPLARFGQYIVTAYDETGQVLSTVRAETIADARDEQQRLQREFPDADVSKIIKAREYNAARDSTSKSFVQKIYAALDNSGIEDDTVDELKDAINQLYLTSMPDASWAKHGIHRKGTPGFSEDARRAFANNMFHGSYYLSKLKHADVLQEHLREMQEYVDSMRDDAGYDNIAAQQVIDEMHRRHDLTMNPPYNPLTERLTAAGFIYLLGASPASALVNMSQTALVAYPMLAAEFGYTRASAELVRASKETARAVNDLRTVLSGEEKQQIEQAIADGIIDITMAHDLAAISEGRDSQLRGAMSPFMRFASGLFHHAEKFNRQATFLATYRMARAKGQSADDAYATARRLTYASHFDYSQSNRPRLMMGPWAKVLFLFKQYGQNMAYTLARNFHQMFAGEDEQTRRIALRNFSGLMVGTAISAGIMGLPLVSILMGIASAAGSDDDEPWDAETAFRNWLADNLGKDVGEMVAHGVFRRILPGDVSSRVDLSSLFVKDIDLTLDPTRVYQELLQAIVGPVGSIAVNGARGASDMLRGDVWRGLEEMLPKSMADLSRAARYNSQGVVDRTGVEMVKDISLPETLSQAAGFIPTRLKESYEGRRSVMGLERKIEARHNELLGKFSKAVLQHDEEARLEALKEIHQFNETQPANAITSRAMLQAIQNRHRRIVEAQNGISLPQRRRAIAEQGRFANMGE